MKQQIVREVTSRMIMPAVVIGIDESGQEVKQEQEQEEWSVTLYDERGHQQLVMAMPDKQRAYDIAARLQIWLQRGVEEILDRVNKLDMLGVGTGG